ncbi:hypothetical protein ABER99_21200 [Paenibacillus glucanolyticus]|jgi:hypothetical protein|uniref:Uncharacterized protein n=1 Tax=Paenibacillus glucanolyticus TaxID=59843 RepID=A0A163G879_9BACL|nr:MULTISPECIES: hypothetical protein [Paenibacillus]KZS44789.1 hypothetical protein AWU65_02015 [Paenibacillus glucanolyticus]MDH6675682.1 hypothetical protein [Paenibacillus sp. LBL]OMF64774.1 hypothetical protein BK142_31640 [Paenibacillus glucanolyticus]
MSEDIRKVFDSDSKTKKRAANGSFSRVKSGRGGMVTAYTLMTKEQQLEYTQCGDGKSYNIYEQIIPIEQFKHLPLDIRKRCWSEWIDKFFMKDILQTWSVKSIDELNLILDEIDIPLVNGHWVEDTSVFLEELPAGVNIEEDSSMTLSDLIASDATVQNFNVDGEMMTRDLIRILEQVITEVRGSNRKFYVGLSIQEMI